MIEATLPPHAAALVLLAALLHASWNAFVKVGGDRLAVLAMMRGVGLGVAAVAVAFVSLPAAPAWPFLVGSMALHTTYYFVLVEAYRVGDLSHVYPLGRGLSPLIVAGLGVAFADETLLPLAVAGVVLASAGIASLAFATGPPWRGDPRPLAASVAISILIAAYTVVDGMGVRRAGGTLSYIAWLALLNATPIVAVALVRRRRALAAVLRANWRPGLAGGLLQLGAYGLVIWAMSVAPMAAVSALRETSVIFAALIGTLLLRERFGGLRIAAASAVACGLILMKVAG